jgi:8-oxo-dGTP pyrophosphatase MutT (NUDIX family)
MFITSREPIRVVKVVLIDSSQRALILRRVETDRKEESPQGYDLPGGGAEYWEDDTRTTAVREVLEETGFSISEDSLHFLFKQELNWKPVVLHFYVAPCPEGDVKLNPLEHMSYHFQDVKEPAKLTPTGWLEDLIRYGADKLGN